MVSVILPDALRDASPLQVTVGAFAATLLAYKLLVPSRPAHEVYAKKHGLTNIKLAPRLPCSHWLLGDLKEIGQNVARFPDWFYDKAIEMGEQPWQRAMPLQPTSINIVSPVLVADVVKTQHDVFGKGEQFHALFHDLIGSGFSAQDGPAWFHQRKTASKFFTTRMFRDVATAMVLKHTQVLLRVLDDAHATHGTVDLTRLFHEFSLQTFAELGFGLDMQLIGNPHGHPLDAALDDALPQIMRRVQMPTWLWKLQRFLNVGHERKYADTTRFIRTLVVDLVQKSLTQMQDKTQPKREAATIVELFIHAMQNDEGGSGEDRITPDVLCDVAIMFVLGGRDTTADTLNWLLLLLGKNPHVEQKVRDELWTKLPELMRGETSAITLEQTQTLLYMEACIKETLRLYGPVPLSLRQANRDTHLVDGTFVPKGATVGMSPYVMGRLQSIWGDDAHEFKPERFIDTASGKLRVISAFDFFSFHAGPRICIGMNLAMLEMKLVIASVLSRFRLDILPNDGSYRFSAGLPLKNPLLARVRPVK